MQLSLAPVMAIWVPSLLICYKAGIRINYAQNIYLENISKIFHFYDFILQ